MAFKQTNLPNSHCTHTYVKSQVWMATTLCVLFVKHAYLSFEM